MPLGVPSTGPRPARPAPQPAGAGRRRDRRLARDSRSRRSSRARSHLAARRRDERCARAGQDPQLGALRPRRGGGHLVLRRGADEARQPTASSRYRARSTQNCRLSTHALAELDQPFAESLFLWQKTKRGPGQRQEMDTALQIPGWGNIWTQPIINRIDMLATGVRTPIGVKVFGDDLDEIQRVSQEVAGGSATSARARSTSSPTRSSARATSRSTSTARRPPATASRSATSRTWSRSPWGASP